MYPGFEVTHDALYTYERVHSPWKPGYNDKLNHIPFSIKSQFGNHVMQSVIGTSSSTFHSSKQPGVVPGGLATYSDNPGVLVDTMCTDVPLLSDIPVPTQGPTFWKDKISDDFYRN